MFHVEHIYMKSTIRRIEKLNEIVFPFLGHFTKEQKVSFLIYHNLLKDWNSRINLISRKDVESIIEKHFLESISLLDVLDFPANSWVLDLGSGGGFPGLPIKILREDLHILMIDAKRMKCLFLKKVLQDLSLIRADVICERVENVSAEFLAKFDFVVCRAVANLAELWNLSQRFLTEDGILVAMKGGDIEAEIDALKNQYQNIQIRILEYSPYLELGKLDKRVVVVSRFSDRKK